MSVFEAAVDDHADAVEGLFREYHAWMKDGVLAAMGGHALTAEELERRYDVGAIVAADLEYLTDPDADGRLFLARAGDGIVGCVFLRWRTEDTAEVKRLYVRPAGRGEGLGRALMATLIDAARNDGCETLLLFTTPFAEAARALYVELGFEVTTPFACEAPEAVYDELVFMRLDLAGATA